MGEWVGRVSTNGITTEVGVRGDGPAVVLVHGFPHTRHLWSKVTAGLVGSRRVIAPDLRGCGGSTRADDGYDAVNLGADLLALLDALEISEADLVAIDAGAPAAFALSLQRPDRVRRLVLMESTLGRLTGAEDFFGGGAPWWFGFHQVPGLAESVLVGHEGTYLDFFFRSGSLSGRELDPDTRRLFVDAYSGTESLRCAFEHYRAMPESGRQLAELTATTRLVMPTMAIGAQPVGDVLHRQLVPVADDLRSELLPDCGHIIPLDQPDALVRLLCDFL